MTSLVFATNNPNKLQEIQQMLGSQFHLQSLNDIGCTDDIPETSATLMGNAIQKAQHIAQKYKVSVFADDTGLEIAALNGEPGVYSARYAGPQRNSSDNIDLVLDKLKEHKNRNAQFTTCIALILFNTNGEPEMHTFQGVVKGEITREKSGLEGFGYDPIFTPEGKNITFAEMSMTQKNEISHRGRAFRKMVSFLKEGD